jgi:hypothetical protein
MMMYMVINSDGKVLIKQSSDHDPIIRHCWMIGHFVP